MLDELFIIVPEELSKLDLFSVNSKVLKVHKGKAIINIYLGAVKGSKVTAQLTELTKVEKPFAAVTDLDGIKLCYDKEQLFKEMPELAGQEVAGVDEDGKDVMRDKIIFTHWAR